MEKRESETETWGEHERGSDLRAPWRELGKWKGRERGRGLVGIMKNFSVFFLF